MKSSSHKRLWTVFEVYAEDKLEFHIVPTVGDRIVWPHVLKRSCGCSPRRDIEVFAVLIHNEVH